ncbi:MAG: hypothetical protein GY743_05200 [Planctomycetaceae bacterium]|nr:hypothetical protein [Planctomycetaceae bacterium]
MSAPLTKKALSVKETYQAASTVLPKPRTKAPRITLRLTEEELATLKNLSSGISLSAFIRKCLFGKDAAPRKVRARVPVKDQEALAQVLRPVDI